jgi:hypothetical protein
MGLFDAHANGASSSVATLPTPANSGVTLGLTPGTGVKFSATPPYDCTITNPTGEKEIVRVTGLTTDTITMIRAYEAIGGQQSPINIAAGATVVQSVTTKTLTDIEGLLSTLTANLSKVPQGLGVVFSLNNGQSLNIPYMQAIGVNAVRVGNLCTYPWTPARMQSTRNIAMAFKAAGFFVQYDIVDSSEPHPITTTGYQQIQSCCVAEAAYLQSIGFIPDLFGCGNELENYNDNSTLTFQGLFNAEQATAAAVKATGYTGKVCYNFSNGNGGAGWNAPNSVGNFDAVAFHPYGSITAPVVPVTNQTISNGLWVGQVPTASPYQYSLSFNGTYPNTSVTLGGSNTTFSSLTDFTWAGWVKSDYAQQGALWSNNYNYGGNLGQTIFICAGGTNNILLYQGSTNVGTSSPIFSTNEWMFLEVKQAGSTVNISVNNQQVLSNATLAPVAQDSQGITVLGYETDSGSYFAGEMLNVGIWNRALTSTEDSGLMGGTYPASGLIGQYLVPSGTVTPAVVNLSSAETVINSWFANNGSNTYISEFNLSGSNTAMMQLTPAQSQAAMQSYYSFIEGKYAQYNCKYPAFFYQWSASSYEPGNFYGPGLSLVYLDGTESAILQYFLGLG